MLHLYTLGYRKSDKEGRGVAEGSPAVSIQSDLCHILEDARYLDLYHTARSIYFN